MKTFLRLTAMVALVTVAVSACSFFRSSDPLAREYAGGVHVRGDSRSAVMQSYASRYIGQMHWPVHEHPVRGFFGPRSGEFHEGVDIPAPRGTDILAAHSGEVVYAGSGINGYGRLVIIKTVGMLTVYAHCDRILVSKGDEVKISDRIAEVGSSGRATGNHLHFETRIKLPSGKSMAVNPLVFFPVKASSK